MTTILTKAFLRQHAVALVLALTVGVMGFKQWLLNRQLEAALSAVDRFSKQAPITPNADALVAGTKIDKHELEELLKAAKAINGKLLAGMKITVPEKVVTVVHDTLPTTSVEGTRTASVLDSTAVGVLKGTITAPPAPAGLSFSYSFTRPKFSPEVGFISQGDKNYAVVAWQGEQYKIEAPYVTKIPKVRKLVPHTDLLIEPTGVLTARAGVDLKVPWLGLGGLVEAEQRFVVGDPARARVGVRKDW